MILNVIDAKYRDEFKIDLRFDNGEHYLIDMEPVLRKEKRNIFQPLKDKNYFQNFEIKHNTITWPNEADFAPEFLLKTAKKQNG